MFSLKERAFNVARALANFDSCASRPFTAATSLSRLSSASVASMVFMRTNLLRQPIFGVVVVLQEQLAPLLGEEAEIRLRIHVAEMYGASEEGVHVADPHLVLRDRVRDLQVVD